VFVFVSNFNSCKKCHVHFCKKVHANTILFYLHGCYFCAHVETHPYREKNFFDIIVSNVVELFLITSHVTILTLGSRPKQGLARVRVKREARESHLMLSGV
jgi:hypothetical protein